MTQSIGWSRVKNIIHEQYYKEEWYPEVLLYFLQRYSSIEKRMINSFRYVDCHPDNANTFSYEYASILRDAGSVFGSVMDSLVSKTSGSSKKVDIRDYRKWLRQLDLPFWANKNIKIDTISVDINRPFVQRVVLPFSTLKDETGRLEWWNAYNNIKHSDIDKFYLGNFRNALISVAGLAVLLALFNNKDGELFINPGLHQPEKHLQSILFFKN